jgi:hypothetical protein
VIGWKRLVNGHWIKYFSVCSEQKWILEALKGTGVTPDGIIDHFHNDDGNELDLAGATYLVNFAKTNNALPEIGLNRVVLEAQLAADAKAMLLREPHLFDFLSHNHLEQVENEGTVWSCDIDYTSSDGPDWSTVEGKLLQHADDVAYLVAQGFPASERMAFLPLNRATKKALDAQCANDNPYIRMTEHENSTYCGVGNNSGVWGYYDGTNMKHMLLLGRSESMLLDPATSTIAGLKTDCGVTASDSDSLEHALHNIQQYHLYYYGHSKGFRIHVAHGANFTGQNPAGVCWDAIADVMKDSGGWIRPWNRADLEAGVY